MSGKLSFVPRPLPQNLTPKGTRCIQITIPDDDEWERDLYSAIQQELALTWNVWQKDVGKNATKVVKRWRQALLTWRHCNGSPNIANVGLEDNMPFFRLACEDNKCYLEFECCPGEWVRLANFDQITPSGQPGAGSPQPGAGGGSAQYCGTLNAYSKFYLPTVVNSGDVINLDSASGAGNDGTSANWYCPDGEQFFAGACVGYASTNPSDPLPTVNHMALIININGTFYPFTSNTITVPPGISSAQAFIQVNDSSISDNAGSYSVCLTVINNQATTWGADLNFILSPNGFTVPSGEGGTWVSGTGWETSAIGGGPSVNLTIKRTLPGTSFTITNYTATVIGSVGHHLNMYADHVGGGHTPFDDVVVPTDPYVHSYSSPGAILTTDTLNLVLYDVLGMVCTKLHFEGTGTNPF